MEVVLSNRVAVLTTVAVQGRQDFLLKGETAGNFQNQMLPLQCGTKEERKDATTYVPLYVLYLNCFKEYKYVTYENNAVAQGLHGNSRPFMFSGRLPRFPWKMEKQCQSCSL